MWQKLSSNRYRHNDGAEIIKYRIAGKWYYLLYPSGYREFADYSTHDSLKLAKQNGPVGPL